MTAADSLPDLHQAVRAFDADRSTVERAYDLRWSTVAFERREQLFRDWIKGLSVTNFDALQQQGKIDYVLLRGELTSGIDRVALQRAKLKEMDELLTFRDAIHELERARWQMREVDGQAAASKVSELADQVKKLRERLEKGKKAKDTNDVAKAKPQDSDKDSTKTDAPPLKPSPALARRTANAVGDLRSSLKSWFSFYDGYQPEFSWWLKKPYDDANSALESYAKFLREEVAELKGKDEDPLLGDAIGREALVRDIESEFLPYTPEELIEIGEREFAWCEAEMKKAAKEMGFDDWKKALTKVKSNFVPPGKQDETVAQFAREAIDFVKQRDLVTVPPLCEDVWRLTMASPETQKSIPYVAYGGGAIIVAYAKDEMKHEDKLMSMRGNNRHFTRITTAHELMPGHHLQMFNAARHRDYRRMFSTPFFVEGWALYWEMRLWDLEFGKTPEDRIGMLFWRMHRGARIIVSLKFHLGQMQPKEMVDFLVDRVGHERFGATSEVRRFIAGDYSPLYQCGYMIGGLQIRSLHKEIVGAGKRSEREFHDTVLTYGPIPVELIRAGMLNLPLTRETKSTWRFAEK
ncbi:MAG TPA: DUF885 family protein [Candidatus Acidoferrum sp.]|nr:DUF885 family protein [Candidatus Acidoferrum sp.]